MMREAIVRSLGLFLCVEGGPPLYMLSCDGRMHKVLLWCGYHDRGVLSYYIHIIQAWEMHFVVVWMYCLVCDVLPGAFQIGMGLLSGRCCTRTSSAVGLVLADEALPVSSFSCGL